MSTAKKNFAIVKGDYNDQRGSRITKPFVVENMTDDGHFDDKQWDGRHSLHPSKFNEVNSVYYKVSFFTLKMV